MNPLQFVLGLFSGGLPGVIKDGLLQAQQQRLSAESDADKLKAEQELAYWENRTAALEATRYDKWYSPRSLMSYAVTLFVFKIIVWDTVLGFGVTEDPGTLVTYIVLTIIGFFFLSKSAEIAVNTIARAITHGR